MDYQQTNMAWVIQQLQQQAGERLERLIPNLEVGDDPWLFPYHLAEVLSVLVPLLIIVVSVGLVWRYLIPSLTRQSLPTRLSEASPRSKQGVDQWREQAQVYQRQGNYREACRCLYYAMLQHLHDLDYLPHRSSRTDGEHRHDLQSFPAFANCKVLIDTHEALCFDHHSQMSATRFEHCQAALDQVITSASRET